MVILDIITTYCSATKFGGPQIIILLSMLLANSNVKNLENP